MMEHLRKSLAATKHAAGKATRPALDLPGFDGAAYLAINPDVATAGADPLDHYLRHGCAEARNCLHPGQGIDHPESRTLSHGERQDWLQVLRQRTSDASLARVVAGHPRSGWLRTGFTLAGYLQENPEIAAQIDDPLEAAFHFLEVGLEVGKLGHPTRCDAAFIQAHHGVTVPSETSSPHHALATVMRSGVSPLDAVLDESQFWDRAGFDGKMLARRFDHEHYQAVLAREGLARPPRKCTRIELIRHFLQDGIDALVPIAPGEAFDAAIYAQQLDADQSQTRAGRGYTRTTSHAAAGTSRLYRHWLRAGSRLGLSPNLDAWGKSALGLGVPEELYRQMPAFALAAGRDPKTNPITLLATLLSAPRPGVAALDLSRPDSAAFLLKLAERLSRHDALWRNGRLRIAREAKFVPAPIRHVSRSDSRAMAEWLCWVILGKWPDHDATKHLLATLLESEGRDAAAQSLRLGIDAGIDAGRATIRLATTQMRQRQYGPACETLGRLPARFSGDVALQEKRRTLAKEIFEAIWGGLGRYVAAHGIETTQAHLAQALTAYTPEFSSLVRSQPIRRVALVGNEDLFQCKLYRVDQKAEQLRAAGLDVTVISPSRELDEFTARAHAYDAAIFFRVPAFPPVIDAIASAAQNGLLTFYEIDDLVFDSDHFPPSLESYAGQIDASDYAAMACGVPLFAHAMSLCDHGIASTETVADLMRPRVRSGEVIVHRNALGRLHEAALDARLADPPTDPPITLLYASGTKAHKEDFHDILEPALARILARHKGRVRIRLVGHFGGFRHLDPASEQVEIHQPVWDFEAYCSLVAAADINLSVLSRSLLTDAKSEIKWMEAAMFAIPSVVSDTATHRQVIEDGVTGFVASDAKGFETALDRLVRDHDLRARVGEAARETVLRDYAVGPMGRSLRDAFDRLRPATQPKKRLMVVNVFYPPQAIGGATRVVHDNVRLLKDRYGDRYEIDVVCTLEGGKTPYEVTTYAHEGIRVSAITAPLRRSGEMAATDPKMAECFERLVERISPDLIHFHCVQRLTASVVNVARLRKIPYLITLHDAWWISPNQFVLDEQDRATFYDYRDTEAAALPHRAQSLLRPVQGAARLLAVSESFAELHRQHGLTNVTTTENGVSSLPACTRTPSASGRVRLAHIGGATRHKGIHIVRNALIANTYENLELLVVDHSYRSGQETHDIWGNTPVTMISKVPQSDIADLFGQVDILLAPSTWPESYGLVTREALACGLWVIASDRGAIGDSVEEGVNGHRVSVDSYEDMAKVLSMIDSAPDRYLAPPNTKTKPRDVAEQVEDLAFIYDTVLKQATQG